MALLAKIVWGSSLSRSRSSSPPLRSSRRRASRTPAEACGVEVDEDASTSSSTDRPTRYARSRHATGCASRRSLLEGAVLQATAAGVEALAAEVDHLSPDIDVASFMSVSNAATGADQVQAGLEGLSAVHRRGHRHRADRLGRLDRPPLARRPRRVFEGFRRRRQTAKADPYGHGTHIGATIAGSSPYPQDRAIRYRSAASRLAPISSAFA